MSRSSHARVSCENVRITVPYCEACGTVESHRELDDFLRGDDPMPDALACKREAHLRYEFLPVSDRYRCPIVFVHDS